MQEVTARAPIQLPIEACWEKLRDLSRAIGYVPGLTDVRITTARKEGVGASRTVLHARTGAMDETVTEWSEGRGFWLRLHRGARGPLPPLREAHFQYALEPAPDGGCEVVTTMRYAVGLGPLGALLDALFLRRLLASSVGDVALALAEHYETDETVTPARLAELRREKRAGRNR